MCYIDHFKGGRVRKIDLKKYVGKIGNELYTDKKSGREYLKIGDTHFRIQRLKSGDFIGK